MPTYLYSDDEGNIEEIQRSVHGKIPRFIRRNSRRYYRDIAAEHRGPAIGDPWQSHYSLAMMVHPDDVPGAQKDAAAKGLGTIDFNSDGMPHFTSRKQQKKYAEAYGFVQLNEYY